MEPFKQVVGIDVSSRTLVLAVGQIDQTQTITRLTSAVFDNSADGIAGLIAFIEGNRQHQIPLWVVMEATGVYYERLAVALHAHGYSVAVVLPNTVKNYAKSHNVKSKTDRIDAETIMGYGLERSLKPWQPAEPVMAELKSLVREHTSINELLTETRNRLHAIEHSATTPKKILKRLRQQRDLFQQQLKQIEQELKELVGSSEELTDSVERMASIPGVGMLTAVTLLAETNNFALVTSAAQLVSYCGLDPQLRESGQWQGTSPISSKGNRHIRRMLYMPALAAIRWNERLRTVYLRIVAAKSVKKIGVVAVMRKLLRLMYTLWKTKQRYDPTFHCVAAVA